LREDLATMKAERSVDKLVLRGRAFASVGDETRAEQYFSAAIDAGGNAAEILPELLRVCIASKRYRVAIEYASPWLEINPRDVRLRFVVASLRASVGDVAAAGTDFQKIVEENPNDASAHFAYAVLLHDQLGDVVRADGEFREYLRLEPNGRHSEQARASLLKQIQ
jgi:tetratricopeptide (TPR) repeat protein